MGDDTLYSGTVAAATEAYLMGIPAIAFSLADSSARYWETMEKPLGYCFPTFSNAYFRTHLMEHQYPCRPPEDIKA